MITKRVLCPERLRQVPQRFSWIDQRLVRDGHIARCGPQALALYLLLVTVADAQGLSYYSDKTAAGLLSQDGCLLGEVSSAFSPSQAENVIRMAQASARRLVLQHRFG